MQNYTGWGAAARAKGALNSADKFPSLGGDAPALPAGPTAGSGSAAAAVTASRAAAAPTSVWGPPGAAAAAAARNSPALQGGAAAPAPTAAGAWGARPTSAAAAKPPQAAPSAPTPTVASTAAVSGAPAVPTIVGGGAVVKKGSAAAKAQAQAQAQAAPPAAAAAPSGSLATGIAAAPPPPPLLTGVPPPPVDYYVVLDFEATCWENERSTQQEIIELPSVLVDARRGVVVSEFQRYVRPVLRPQLSDFCTTLTGIPQAVVSEGKKFADCLTDYVAWLRACGLAAAGTSGASFLFVTCGDWDLKTMLPLQLRNLTSAEYDTVPAVKAAASLFGRWVNIKFALSDNAPRVGLPPRYRSGGMDGMLSALKLPLVGFHHSGIDDCRNIAQILIALLRAGATVTATAAAPGQGLAPPASTIDRATAPAFVSMEATSSLAPVSPPAQAELDALRVRLQAARGVTVAQPTRAAASAAAAAPPRPEAGQRTARDAVGGAAAAAPSDAGAAAPAPAALAPAVAVDTTRDVATEILAAAGMTDVASAFGIADAAAATAASVRVSRTLSSCLRHNALEWGLPLTENGFVPVEALLAHPRIKSNRVTLPQLAAVCKFSDKGRYCLAIATPIPGAPATTANTFIRANQGHSIPNVLVDLTPITHPSEAPQLVVHGTYRKAVPLIRASGGLSRMGRLHVHFAQGLPGDQGVISGMRGNAEVLFYLDVARALAAGLPLLRSANGVILTPGFGPEGIVPLELMSAVVDARSRVPIEMD